MQLAVVNARIRSDDPRRPWADAIVVDGDVIVFVGSSAEARKRAAADTRIVDARGMSLLQRGTPGSFDLVDATGAVVVSMRHGAIV